MDFQIYALVMPTLIGLWGLSKTQAGTLATAVLIIASVGGWIAGALADRIGRVRVLQITILWFAVFTFLSGLTTSYWQLLLTRSLQGIGFGGEWAVGAVLISEVVAPEIRGRVVGVMHSGWAVGYGTAVVLSALLFSSFSEIIAWRLLFFVGLLPTVIVFFIWRYVDEPKVFLENRTRTTEGKGYAFWEIFSSDYIGRTTTATILATGVYGGNYVLITWLPSYLKMVLHLSLASTSGYLALTISGSFVGAFVNAYLSDLIGRRYTFVVCALCQAVTLAAYILVSISPLTRILLGFVLGTMQSGTAAGMGAAFSELFPTRIRATGQGFSANAGRAIGALFPTLVGILSVRMPLGKAMAACALVAYGILVVAALMMPETRGIDLSQIADRNEEIPPLVQITKPDMNISIQREKKR